MAGKNKGKVHIGRRKPSLRSDADAWALAEKNKGLAASEVYSVFRHFRKDEGWIKANFDDAFQDSMFGLFRACQLYNPYPGLPLVFFTDPVLLFLTVACVPSIRLSTYVTHAVRRKIERWMISDSTVVYYPAHLFTKERIKERKPDFPTNKRLELSLDHERVVDGKPDWSFLETSAPSPDEEAERRDRQDKIARLINLAIMCLSRRDRGVVLSRYFKGLTLQETAEEMGVCRERVRQLQNAAIKKMQDFMKRKYGKDWLKKLKAAI